jgi:hypothetical protein
MKVWRVLRYPVLAFSFLVGIYAILASYQLATTNGVTLQVGLVFWIGYLTLMTPQIIIILHPSSQFWSRVAALSAVGLFSALPKMLRSLSGPIYTDEFGHLKVVSDILTQGYISPINSIVAPAPNFPALHYLTAYIADITQFSIWTSANIVTATAHVLTLLGVFALLRIKVSPRSAAVASLVYAANPNWMFFQSKFAYETLGIMLSFWVLFFIIRGLESAHGQRLMMLIVAGPLIFVLSQSHHLSFVATLSMIILYVTIYAAKHYKEDKTSLFLSVSTLVWVGLWALPSLVNHGGYLLNYLAYALTNPSRSNIPFILESLGISDSDLVESELSMSPIYSSLPTVDLIAGALLPVILGALLGFYLIRGIKSQGNVVAFLKNLDVFQLFALTLVGLYFLILPFVFIGEYTLVRRSWSFLILGFAVLAATLYENYLLSIPKKQRARPPHWRLINSSVIILFMAISYSSLSNGATSTQRFPAPEFEMVHSVESANSKELLDLAAWVNRTIPDNSWVLADKYTRLALTYPGRLSTAPLDETRFPFWELYAYPESANPQIVKSAHALGVKYLVVHKLTFVIPTSYGYWFHPSERSLYGDLDLYNYNIVEKFSAVDWVETVWSSDNYVVYKVDWDIALEGVEK